MQTDQDYWLCFSCGSAERASGSNQYTCSSCSCVMSSHAYEERNRLASKIHLYAFSYREQYEHDLQEYGNLNRRYSIQPPGELVTFVALAVASGVIGNAAYDVVKALIRRAAHSVRDSRASAEAENRSTLATPEELDEIFALLANDAKYLEYENALKDFFDGMPTADPRVSNAIVSEAAIDEIRHQVRLQGPEELLH